MTGRLKVYDADTGTWKYVDAAVLPVASGTVFPTGPAVNDVFFRTDLHTEYFWNGTYWLTTALYSQPIAMQTVLEPISVLSYYRSAIPSPSPYSYYVEQFWAQCYLNGGTSNASNYWSIACFGTTLSTAAMAVGTVATLVTNINAFQNNPLANWMQITPTKVGTPGTLYLNAMYSYRLVGPP